LRIKFLNIELSKSVLKNALYFSLVLISIYILFNIYSYTLLKYFLNLNLDSKIQHEIENIYNSFKYENNSIVILRADEFKERDLTTISESPYFLQVYSVNGKLLLNSKNISMFSAIEIRFPDFSEIYFFENLYSIKSELRVGYKKIYDDKKNNVAYLQLSVPKSNFNTITNNYILLNLITLPLVILIVLVISVAVSKKAFSPINKIINLANNISTHNLYERLSYKADNNDELGKLRNTLNALFERLELQVKQISSFTDNASHQLMTPLTAINSELDFLLRDENKTVSGRESLLMLKEQTDRMISIIKSLLLLARNRNSDLEQKTVFNFSKMISENIKKIYKNHKIEYDVADEIYMRGRPDYFLIALQNLIDNALKYSDNNGVTILARQEKGKVIIRIEDFGIGIDTEEKKKVFEKFYRTEKVEQLGIKGYGLGLSLVWSIISSMQGTIEIQDNQPKGTNFIITLPALEIE